MSDHTASAIVDQLHHAGLNLSLAPAGGLAVASSSHLTEDLRDLIRGSKALLIDWLTAANDAASHAPDPPSNPLHCVVDTTFLIPGSAETFTATAICYPCDEVRTLPREIRDYEPVHTLTDSSDDGLGLVGLKI